LSILLFNHIHIVMPLQTNFSSRLLGMEPHHQTYTMLGQGGQVSGWSRWTVARRPLWGNTLQVNLQLSIHKEWRPCMSGLNSDHVRLCRLNRPDHIQVSLSYFFSICKLLRMRQLWINWFLGSIFQFQFI